MWRASRFRSRKPSLQLPTEYLIKMRSDAALVWPENAAEKDSALGAMRTFEEKKNSKPRAMKEETQRM